MYILLFPPFGYHIMLQASIAKHCVIDGK